MKKNEMQKKETILGIKVNIKTKELRNYLLSGCHSFHW